MAIIRRKIGRKICSACFGSGKEQGLTEPIKEFKEEITRPTPFDLDCCKFCDGIGSVNIIL